MIVKKVSLAIYLDLYVFLAIVSKNSSKQGGKNLKSEILKHFFSSVPSIFVSQIFEPLSMKNFITEFRHSSDFQRTLSVSTSAALALKYKVKIYKIIKTRNF